MSSSVVSHTPQRLSFLEYFYPEARAGGFSRVSSSVDFYTRVKALMRPEFTVLDFGAGRGQAAEEPNTYIQSLMKFRGTVRKVVGADVDPVIYQNPWLDEAQLIQPAGPLPFAADTFDMVISDWTMEHIATVTPVVAELTRVLKPGGWLCFRTPNRWGYVALASRLIPAKWHAAVLRRVQPNRQSHDVFPTHYCLNTKHSIITSFNLAYFDIYIYALNGEPGYCGSSWLLWGLTLLTFKLTPNVCKAVFHVFMQKKG